MFIEKTSSNEYVQQVHGLSPLETALAKSFLQGCVYGWCKNNGTEPFRAQFFLGGDNYFWQCTPMFAVYEKRMAYYDDDWEKASKRAGIDAGWLLKDVLKYDKRNFHTWTGDDGFRWYQWDGNTQDEVEISREYHRYILAAKNSLEPDVESFIIE